MKTRSHLLILTLPLLLAACTQDSPLQPTAESLEARGGAGGRVVHAVTGSGLFRPAPGFEYRLTLAAHKNAAGSVRGRSVTNLIDSSLFGIADRATLVQEVTCLEVEGNFAWIKSVVVHSNNAAVVAPGTQFFTWIQDLGHRRADIGHSALLPPELHSVTCADRPAPVFLDDPSRSLLTPVVRGNFNVR